MKPVKCKPFIKIIEQPARDRSRFRYEYEGSSALVGASSTANEKTQPKIQVVGYEGKAVLIVSCVTREKPYRPHPFKIAGKEGCKKGICTLHIDPSTMTVNLSIVIKCVRKKDIAHSLKQRQEMRIDPFRTGFDKKQKFDSTSVRLAFQVFIEGENGKFSVPLLPVVSDPIYDKKYMPDLVINRISQCVCRVDESPEIIMLCGKISMENIKVRFYEEQDDVLIWNGYGLFTENNIYRNMAITFRPPEYFNQNIESPVKVQVQLLRSSDGATSASIPFEFLPSTETERKKKQHRIESLLDVTRFVCENCNYNPLMKNRAANRQSPFVPVNIPPNIFSVNFQNSSNIRPTSQIQQMPSNVPNTYNIQPDPSYHQAQQNRLNNFPMNVPNAGTQNITYQLIPQTINDYFDVSEIAGAVNTDHH